MIFYNELIFNGTGTWVVFSDSLSFKRFHFDNNLCFIIELYMNYGNLSYRMGIFGGIPALNTKLINPKRLAIYFLTF